MKMRPRATSIGTTHRLAVATAWLALCVLALPPVATADLTDEPVSWSNFDGTVVGQTANGEFVHDYQTSSDPSSGGTGVGADPIDIGSEWDGIDDTTAPHELCNPELSSETANGRCGPETSAFWGYWDGGTPFDPLDPTTADNDYIFLRMRLVGTPEAGGGAMDFAANHWNFLIDTDDNGYKDYWLDVDGGFNLGNASNRVDHIQVLYEPTTIPEIDCGGGGDTQRVLDADDARVAEYVACAVDWETVGETHPCALSHTRVLSDGTQYYLDIQLPLVALKDLNCDGCTGGGTGGIGCTPGQQLVEPLPGGVPDVAYFFSTGNSAQDPLQKDFIAQCELAGSPPDGPCSFPDATPVTLASIASSAAGSTVGVDWTTATQTATVGFNVYSVDRGGWHRLNEALIPAGPTDTVVPQHFSFEAVTRATSIGLEDIDTSGRARRHGPFSVGSTRGADPTGPPIQWARIASELDSTLVKRGRTGRVERDAMEIDLVVDRDGIYRITFEELLAVGFDVTSIPASSLALVDGNGPVAILVTGGPTFGPGSAIEFVGEALTSLYTHSNRYRLLVNGDLALRTPVEARPPRPGAAVEWHLATMDFERQRDYLFAAPSNDPWLDTTMVAYTNPIEWSFDLEADNLVSDVSTSELTVRLWGGTDWPDAPDHHAIILVNGVQIADRFFDGLTLQEVSGTIPDGVLQTGANTLTIRLPGDTGVEWDVVHLDNYELKYPRTFAADGNGLTFSASGSSFRVDDLPGRSVVIYQLGPDPVRVTGALVERSETGFSASFAGTELPTEHLVTTETHLLSPVLEWPTPGHLPQTKHNDLLIISHAHFMGSLEPLVTARLRDGLRVEVVDVAEVYAAYSRGVVDPQAIRSYIADAASLMGTRYVLLVGGDTFDYHDYLGIGAISFLPSVYAATDDLVSHAPVDPLFGDIDDDGVPDIAVGRFPVRTMEEADRLVAKTIAYDRRRGRGFAVVAADAFDTTQDLNFSGFAERLVADLPPQWRTARAYVDALGFDAARETLIKYMNEGAPLTTYVGHSGPTMWNFDGLFHVNDIADLTNFGRPTVAMQWGCWNTYYVEPRYDSIGDALLLHGDQGAAAILGSTTLSWVPSARAFSEFLGPVIAQPGVRIGDAMIHAKRELAASHPDARDVLWGWTLLGDPTLVLSRE